MALVSFEGFEGSGAGPEWSGVSAGTGGARTGSYAARLTYPATVTLSPMTKCTTGVAFYIDTISSGGLKSLIAFVDSGGVTHLTLAYDQTVNQIKLYRGGVAGTLLATGPVLNRLNWYYVEMQGTIDDTVGTCRIRVDETEVINYVGDTRNAGVADITSVVIGVSLGNTSSLFDDVYILDGVDASASTGRPDNDFLGTCKVYSLLPNGNGVSSGLLGSDGNSVDNYLLVDEAVPNTTDYVSSATPGTRDLYALAAPDPAASDLMGIRVRAYVAKTDTGAINVKTVLKEDDGIGAEALSPLIAPTVSWTWGHDTIRASKPSGGAWTNAALNALQIGVEVQA